MNNKQIERAIQKNAKKVIAESGIGSSRAGNKELSHLVTRLSSQPIHNIETAQLLGERLGQKIVELSQRSNKQHLDRGIIHTLVLTKTIPSIEEVSARVPTDVPASNASQASQPSASVKPSISKQKPEPVVQPAAKSAPEDKAPDIQARTDEEFAPKTEIAQVEEETKTEPEEGETAADLPEASTAAIPGEDDTEPEEGETAADLFEASTAAIPGEDDTEPEEGETAADLPEASTAAIPEEDDTEPEEGETAADLPEASTAAIPAAIPEEDGAEIIA
jgi:hypothetical protein